MVVCEHIGMFALNHWITGLFGTRPNRCKEDYEAAVAILRYIKQRPGIIDPCERSKILLLESTYLSIPRAHILFKESCRKKI